MELRSYLSLIVSTFWRMSWPVAAAVFLLLTLKYNSNSMNISQQNRNRNKSFILNKTTKCTFIFTAVYNLSITTSFLNRQRWRGKKEKLFYKLFGSETRSPLCRLLSSSRVRCRLLTLVMWSCYNITLLQPVKGIATNVIELYYTPVPPLMLVVVVGPDLPPAVSRWCLPRPPAPPALFSFPLLVTPDFFGCLLGWVGGGCVDESGGCKWFLVFSFS